ncbi:MAG: serine hydrolase, partial [Caulobacteraceae bacterium]
AGLPPGAALAHKTGSSGTDLGFTPATNDIGIVTLKDGRRFAIAAFLAASTATEPDRDKLIADAARLAVRAMG